MRKNTKLILVLLIVVLCAAFFSACSKNNYSVDESPSDVIDSGSSAENSAILPEGVSRKIVYNVNMNVTVADMEQAGDVIEDKVYALGGWVDKSEERANTSYSNNYYIIKIPSDKLFEFLDEIENLGEVTSKNTESTDITTQYVSATAKKQALETERDALNALELTDMSEIYERSRRVREINTELNALQLEINGYNSLVDYSRVNIYLYSNNGTIEETSYGGKLSNIFKASVRSLGLVFIGIVAVFPYAAIIGIIIGAVFGIRFLIKKYRKPQKAVDDKKDNKIEQDEEDK